MLRHTKKTVECPICENRYDSELQVCPHCHCEYQIGLELTDSEYIQLVNELKKKMEDNPGDKNTRKELANMLYFQAMNLRYDDPSRSLALFEELVTFQPDHWEARMKVSWLAIRFTKYDKAIETLIPLVESSESTLLQKQRAYTNLSCAEDWKKEHSDPTKAESWARKGIELDREGTSKLWENLAISLKNQNRLDEARVAFKRALKLNPKSLNVIERQASIDRHLLIQKQGTITITSSGAKTKKFHLKSPRDLLGGKKDFVKM